jgi:uncharacterized membrane protein YccF (DUF307 family)
MVSVMIWMVLFGWWDVMIQENDSKGMELTLIWGSPTSKKKKKREKPVANCLND